MSDALRGFTRGFTSAFDPQAFSRSYERAAAHADRSRFAMAERKARLKERLDAENRAAKARRVETTEQRGYDETRKAIEKKAATRRKTFDQVIARSGPLERAYFMKNKSNMMEIEPGTPEWINLMKPVMTADGLREQDRRKKLKDEIALRKAGRSITLTDRAYDKAVSAGKLDSASVQIDKMMHDLDKPSQVTYDYAEKKDQNYYAQHVTNAEANKRRPMERAKWKKDHGGDYKALARSNVGLKNLFIHLRIEAGTPQNPQSRDVRSKRQAIRAFEAGRLSIYPQSMEKKRPGFHRYIYDLLTRETLANRSRSSGYSR